MITQNSPEAFVGKTTELPNPALIPIGYTFYDRLLNVLYERTPSGWSIVGGVGAIGATVKNGVVQRIFSQDSQSGPNIVLATLADLERVSGGGADFSVTLPASGSLIQGIRSVIRNISNANMTVKASAGDDIDGQPTVLVSKSIQIQLGGTSWTSF